MVFAFERLTGRTGGESITKPNGSERVVVANAHSVIYIRKIIHDVAGVAKLCPV